MASSIAADGTAERSERVKITAVTATPIALPLAQPFRYRSGVQEGVNLVLFAVETGRGRDRIRRVDLRRTRPPSLSVRPG